MTLPNRPPDCLRCSGRMEEGFIFDQGHGYRTVSSWIAGTPEESFWTGVNLRGKEKREIKAYRCPRCGYLESYA